MLHCIYRRGPLSYRTPDFSRVEPRVRFPKSGYKPPKSRGSSKTSVSAEPPLVFKSPADIVREVLLSSIDDSPQPFDSITPASAPNSTVPEEFRCPQQATTLIEQLQVHLYTWHTWSWGGFSLNFENVIGYLISHALRYIFEISR